MKSETNTLEDSAFRFSIKVPSGWDVEKAQNDNSYFRLYMESPEHDSFLRINGYKLDGGNFDLERFSDADASFFKLPEKAYKTDLIHGNTINKYYKSKNDTLVLSFRENINFGYILLYSLKSERNELLKKSLSSFHSYAPFSILGSFFVLKNRLILTLKPLFGNGFSNFLATILFFVIIPFSLFILALSTQDKKLLRIISFIIAPLTVGFIVYLLLANIWLSAVYLGVALFIMIAALGGFLFYLE